MGAWGHRNFENDPAADLADEFTDMPGEVVLLEALSVIEEIGEEGGIIEADDASAALAAAEIVAAALGRPGPDLPQDVMAAVAQLDLGEDSELQEMAQEAVEAMLRASELKELMQEGADYDRWVAVQQDLLARLQ
ncbi:hypothetical protein GCM10023185_21180 [Hymenobacter saemangeumensis]|uniref:DUF4259 domain-containing protein n=1 Tax=Hymenobacter saemangeumensis TaxID=1084522 RepID=A0ABP8IE80_9BACT